MGGCSPAGERGAFHSAGRSRGVSVSRTLGRPNSYMPGPAQLTVMLGLDWPKELRKKLVAES